MGCAMKNVDKVIAQAREWTLLAFSLTGLDCADLSTLAGAKEEYGRASERCYGYEYEYKRAMRDAAHLRVTNPIAQEYAVNLERDAYDACTRVSGAYDAVGGLVRLWSAADGSPKYGSAAYSVAAARNGFLDCARGLAMVFSPCNRGVSLNEIGHIAEVGAAELFDRLTSEEGVAEQ